MIHLNKGYHDIGYNYVISKESGKWKVHVGRSMNVSAAHCVPDKQPYAGKYMNYSWVGICIIGDYSKHAPCDEAINEVAYLIKELFRKKKVSGKIGKDTVIGHCEASYTICPGPFTMEKIYRKLGV